jgi:CRISPR/Cas system-associated exonuclease Cas4 (RecB family)
MHRRIESSTNRVLVREAAAFLRRHASGESLLVAAHAGAGAELLRQASAGGLAGVHRVTLPQLAFDLAAPELARRGWAAVSRLGLEALAARTVARERGRLSYYAPVADAPGFAAALANTLEDLRMAGVNGDALRRRGAGGPDLARILESFGRELATHGFADRAAVFALALEAAEGTHRLLGIPAVLLDVPLRALPERELAARIVERAPASLTLALAADRAAAQRQEDPPALRLDHLRRRLFETVVPPAGGEDASFAIFSAPGDGLEAVEMARRILALAREGVPFDRVAVLLRSPERYQPHVEEALRRAGIPGYFTRGSARPSVAGRAFLALLQCAAEGGSASRFAEYLSLGEVPGVDAAGAPQPTGAPWTPPASEFFEAAAPAEAPEPSPAATPDQPVVDGTLRAPAGWERLLVDASVVGGGPERWRQRLGGLRAELELQLAEAGRAGGEREGFLRRQLENLGHLERFSLPVIAELWNLPRSARWGEWLEALGALADLALRRPEPVHEVLHELAPMADVGPVGLDEVHLVLAPRLRLLRSEPPASRYGRVWVGTIEEARGRTFDAVFLPGLAEGLFPRRLFEDPLLLDAERAALSPALELREHRVAEERQLLRTAAAAAERRFVASYPRLELAQARPRVPSFYALELPRAIEGRLPALRAFEQAARAAAPARLNWPAPRSPEAAVDDAEYDLAALGALTLPGALAVKGAAHYLVSASETLARNLRTRWRRWQRHWSSADGLVDPGPEDAAALEAHRLGARPYSATALQEYAACPYRFLLAAIHGLRPREAAARLERLDPLTRGSLFHEVQFRLLTRLREQGLLPLDPWRREQILSLADEALDAAAGQLAERVVPALPRVWKSQIEDLRTDLRGWLLDLLQADTDWAPAHFELAFGMEHRAEADPASVREPVAAAGALLRGSIDLVERHRKRGVLRVTDHKTGRPPDARPRWVGGGRVLQPLLYAAAAETLLGSPVEAGRLYFATQRGGYVRISIAADAAARLRLEWVLNTIDGAVEAGFLPAAPLRGECERCDYRVVCGPYEELRVQRKPQDRLQDLNALRGMP